MIHVSKNEVPERILKGRAPRTVFGSTDALFESHTMTYGYGRFSPDYDLPDPHVHAEEIIYVDDCKNATIRFGPTEDTMGEPDNLRPGDTLRFDDGEWHVFGYTDVADGFIDILFFYPSVGNIRPEDNK